MGYLLIVGISIFLVSMSVRRPPTNNKASGIIQNELIVRIPAVSHQLRVKGFQEYCSCRSSNGNMDTEKYFQYYL